MPDDDFDPRIDPRIDPDYEAWAAALDAAWAARPEPTDDEVAAMLAAANLDRVPF